LRLFFAPTSPFVRKVLACAIARGIENRIEKIPTSTQTSTELPLANPLGKVPCLLLDDGTPVYDSPVICDYLDTIGDAPPLMPASGPARLRAAVMQALADGIMDAAVLRRGQLAHPQDEGRTAVDARQKAAVERGLDRLEASPPEALNDVGAISVACALGYLDFRFAAEPWRDTRPQLAAWFAAVSALPPLAGNAPA
jgi:glutathione S-transferase